MPEFSFDRWFRLEVATASIHLVAFFAWYALSREGHHSWWMGFSLARLVYAALAMVLLDANLDDPDTQYSLYLATCAWYLAGLAILELAILKNIRTISSVTASMARKCRHIKTSKYLLFSALVLFIVATSLLGTTTSPILPKIGAILYRVGIIILLVWYLGTLPLCGLLLFWDIRKKLSTTESVMLWGLLASVPFMIILLVFQLTHTHGILVVFNTTFAHHVSLTMVMEFVVIALNLVAAWTNERLEAKFTACAVFVISTIADIAELSLTEDSFLHHTGSSLVTVISIDTLKLALGPAFFSRQAIIARVAQRACLEISVYPGHRQSLFGKTQYFLDIERSHERILKYVADQIPRTLLNVDEGTLVSTAAINAIRHFRHLTERLSDEEDRVQGNPEIEAQLKSKVKASMTTSTVQVTETEVDKGSSDSLALQVRNPNWEVQLHERDLPVELRNRPRVYEIENGPSTENAVTLYSSEIAARNATANSNKFKRLTHMPHMPERSLSRTSATLPP